MRNFNIIYIFIFLLTSCSESTLNTFSKRKYLHKAPKKYELVESYNSNKIYASTNDNFIIENEIDTTSLDTLLLKSGKVFVGEIISENKSKIKFLKHVNSRKHIDVIKVKEVVEIKYKKESINDIYDKLDSTKNNTNSKEKNINKTINPITAWVVFVSLTLIFFVLHFWLVWTLFPYSGGAWLMLLTFPLTFMIGWFLFAQINFFADCLDYCMNILSMKGLVGGE